MNAHEAQPLHPPLLTVAFPARIPGAPEGAADVGDEGELDAQGRPLAWKKVDLGRARALLAFQRNSVEIRAMEDIRANELFTGDIEFDTSGRDHAASLPDVYARQSRKRARSLKNKKPKPRRIKRQGRVRASLDAESDEAESAEEEEGEEDAFPWVQASAAAAAAAGKPQAKGKGKAGQQQQKPSPVMDFIHKQRSNIFIEWSKAVLRMDDALGFVPVSFVESDATLSPIHRVDTRHPVVLNLEEVKDIQVAVTLHGQYHWRVYDSNSRLVPNVIVFGTNLPAIRGDKALIGGTNVARVMDSPTTKLYLDKLDWERRAEVQLSDPGQLLQEANAAGGTNGGKGGAGGGGQEEVHDTTVPLPCDPESAKQMRITRSGGAEVATRRLPGESDEEWAVRMQALGLDPTQSQWVRHEVPPGKVLAGNRVLPKAPENSLIWREAYLQVISLAYGVPLPLVSQGDTTGSAKLNSKNATPEQFRLFQSAQQERKNWLETQIARIWHHMYDKETLTNEVTHRATVAELHRAEERGRGSDSDSESASDAEMAESSDSDSDDSGVSGSDEDEHRVMRGWERVGRVDLRAKAQFRATIPARVPIDVLMMLHREGIITFEALSELLSRNYNLSSEVYPTKPPPTELGLKELQLKQQAKQAAEQLEQQSEQAGKQHALASRTAKDKTQLETAKLKQQAQQAKQQQAGAGAGAGGASKAKPAKKSKSTGKSD